MDKANRFPPDFIWGTATAAFQIEGAAHEDGKGPSIWDTFCRQPGRIADGSNGDVACDHYHRLDEDLDLIAGVAPHYRFSVSWPRILPAGTGAVNQAGIDFYNRLIDGLRLRGITPWLTLYHWDLPQALQDKGGWANREIVGWFENYAEICAKAFGDRIQNWMIINEPSVVSYMSNALGYFAPGLRDEAAYWRTVHHLNLVTAHEYRHLKALLPQAQIGSTFTPVPCRIDGPHTQGDIDLLESAWHWNFLDPLLTGRYPDIVADRIAPYTRAGDDALVRADLDFIGLQHYSPIYFEPDAGNVLGFRFGKTPADMPQNDLGWCIDPPAFEDILLQLHRKYGKRRWIVTENGISLNDTLVDGQVHDPRRIAYLEQYLAAIAAARETGMEIGGYFVWSLMDNFEWASGYGPRFGLVFIDYADGQRRVTKESYRWYKNFVDDMTKKK